jgi:hypothetical protein
LKDGALCPYGHVGTFDPVDWRANPAPDDGAGDNDEVDIPTPEDVLLAAGVAAVDLWPDSLPSEGYERYEPDPPGTPGPWPTPRRVGPPPKPCRRRRGARQYKAMPSIAIISEWRACWASHQAAWVREAIAGARRTLHRLICLRI